MNLDIIFITVCILTAIVDATPIALLKTYLDTKKTIWIVLSLCCYPLLVLCYIYILNTKSLSVVYSLIKILSILIISAYSFIYLREKLSFIEKIGIFLAVGAIIFLSG
jgi:multidrug transporter EmrE-like cation transporter